MRSSSSLCSRSTVVRTSSISASLGSGVLQITCTVPATVRGGENALDVIVAGKGRAALPDGEATRTFASLVANAVSPHVLSTLGASQLTVTGAGFDAVTCSRNSVTVGGVVCPVTACTATTLVATYPGGVDTAAEASNVDTTTETPTAVALTVAVLEADGATVRQSVAVDGLVSLAEGGATAAFCALASGNVAGLGAAAELQVQCSAAAVAAGVVSLHLVPAAAAGVGAPSTARRRLADAAAGPPTAADAALQATPPGAVVCKVCARSCGARDG